MTTRERRALIARAELLAARTTKAEKILGQERSLFLISIAANGNASVILNFSKEEGLPAEFFAFLYALIEHSEQERRSIWKRLNAEDANEI